MFAGLLALIIDQDLTRKENMCSREGREIPFPTPIILKNSQKINNRLSKVESQMKSGISLKGPLQIVLKTLDVLALVRDVIRLLIKDNSVSRFEWSYHMRFYLEVSVANPIESLSIHMANAVFPYGFKYLGTFDFQATGRIFVGLFQVGAWERILSAVSHLIQSIKLGLGAISFDQSAEVEIVGKMLWINTNRGIVITMNPGYAGRSNLPDNLKLFRSMAMTRPEFRTAETLSSKVVPFFSLCSKQLSRQPNYNFVLVISRRRSLQAGEIGGAIIASVDQREQCILIQSVTETILSKLVAEHLKEHIHHIVSERHLVVGNVWSQKVPYVYQIQNIQHRLMMVGPLATGKTGAWRALLGALGRLVGLKVVSYVVDSKAISKDFFYDSLNPTTPEWNFGLFTNIIRKIIDNVGDEVSKQHWIIFMAIVLDDSKLLTLFIGKRLSLPNNVRIIFEVESLNIPPLPLSIPQFETVGLVTQALDYSASVDHIMEFTIAPAVSTLFALINKMIGNVPDHNARHSNFPLQQEYFNAYAKKHPLVAIVWAFTQDSEIDRRAKMAIFL
ncbi:hypothetical protein PPACK8108_LOCUS16878 [Phakopsora pachyrhizi]|uniref:Uncharacterized protein n=1 Tax=Phakopsora pachyrhizi TaxID=170000 RepID=A0AAV0BC24_PHAPC|nr:hypothetical protein PPACK8108_LOCUS16878 [Phakopsora pachyrhizi]